MWLKSLDTGGTDCVTVFAFDFSNIRSLIQLITSFYLTS